MPEMKTLNGYEIVDEKARTEKVGFTDYATGDKAGVVRIYAGGITIGDKGKISISKATDTEINYKGNEYKPIVPKNLDYAVKMGLTANKLTLTEEEQAAAQEWLGISGGNSGSANELEWISLGVYTLETEMGQDENTGINYSVAVPKMINVFGTAYLNRPWDFADGTPGSSYDDVSFNALIPCSKFGRVDFSTITHHSISGCIYQIIGSVNVTKTTEDNGSVTVKAEPYVSYFYDISNNENYSIDYTQGYSYETKILTYKD